MIMNYLKMFTQENKYKTYDTGSPVLKIKITFSIYEICFYMLL